MRDKMKKKVQILMSTYNGEKYLREQIDSLLNQDYPNVEILIRDDGSKDDTKNILFEYQKKYTAEANYDSLINIYTRAEKLI